MVTPKLHKYQRYAADFVKQRRASGLFLDMGLGKCIDDNTLMPTPFNGFVKAKDIKINDYLFDRKGKPTKVLKIYKHHNKKSYQVILDDNRSFICCDEHLIPFYESTLIKNKQLKDIIKDYKRKHYNIPSNEAVDFPKSSHKVNPSIFAKEIKSGKHTEISNEYLFDSKKNRELLLNNLTSSTYVYSKTNKKLKNQMIWIAQSLGYKLSFETNKLNSHQYRISQISKARKSNRIISITEVEPRNMVCFSVDNDEKLYLINDFIVTHNTLITLTALSELAQEGRLRGNILVIAPKKIAVNTWPDEIEKWDHTKNAKYTVITGLKPKQKKELFDEIESNPKKAQFYFVNRELVPELVKRFSKNWPFPNVIIDELQSFKGYSSSRFKSLKKVRNQINFIVGLTGTPAPNSLMDLWAQITLLDGGFRLGRTISAFREEYFLPGRRTPQGFPYEWLLKENTETDIYNKINDIVVSMKASDYLDMPPITYNTIKVKMTKKEQKVYNTLKKEKVLPLLDGSEITSANAAVLTAQLLQLSNGAIYNNNDEKDVNDIILLHDHKLEALEDIIDSSQGQPLVVFYWYKHDLIRLTKHFPQAEVFDGSRAHKDKWNRGEVPILLLQPSSSGHGLNLQDGGHIIVWFALPNWSLELYQQGNARVFRQGQTSPVIVHHIVTENTMDDKVLKRLAMKDENQNKLLNAVKAQTEIISDVTNDLKSEFENL